MVQKEVSRQRVKQNTNRRKNKSKSRNRIGPLYVVLTSIFLVLAATWTIQLSKTEQAMDAQIAELNQKKADYMARNAALRHEAELLNTPFYIEQLAREKLGLVRKGEIVIAPKEDGNKAVSP